MALGESSWDEPHANRSYADVRKVSGQPLPDGPYLGGERLAKLGIYLAEGFVFGASAWVCRAVPCPGTTTLIGKRSMCRASAIGTLPAVHHAEGRGLRNTQEPGNCLK